VDPSLSPEKLKELGKGMCQLLKHGGPDDEGVFLSEENSLILCNRRLALLDLSQAGHQPMSYADGSYHITYNGEIYNFPELKAELAGLGYSFRSNSDTEVILASYSAWGTDAFEKLNGMFAIALFDKTQSALYLVRDPGGIKPLYYSIDNDQLVFASETRVFKLFPGLTEEENHWQVYMMAYGHLPEPITTLKKVKPLPKGHFLRYDLQTATYKIIDYCRYEYAENIGNREEAIALVKDTLSRSVKRHLLSDAPIGVFLSGGLDSSITALLANDKGNRHLNTLSLYFAEAHYSEKKYQDMVLHRLSCNHHQHLLSEVEFNQHFPHIINNMDLPSTDGVNTWFISKYAKETGLKAVLSGVGGDELYGGYPSFKRMGKVNMLEKLPGSLLRSKTFGGSKKLKRLSYLSLGGAKGKYLFLRGHFIPSEIAQQLNMDESQVWDLLREQPVMEKIDNLSTSNQASWIEMNLYMQNQLLRDSDVMSMAHGVEIRVPFLDKEFVELSMQIQSGIKYSGRYSKQLLIDAFKDVLP
jgi:asparagine synthase (glutamine-hydrolysing)